MATAEQMQEALQQIQMLTARVTTLETQLQFESARAQTAEQERSALIQTLVTTRQERAGGIVDTKGIGQPFMWKGSADQDFAEWSHKVRTFMLARFGDDILTALTWAARQRKIVAKTCVVSKRIRMLSRNTVFGEQAGEDEIENIDGFVGKAPRLPCVLYNRRSKPDRSKLWRRKWLGKPGDDCTASTARHRP